MTVEDALGHDSKQQERDSDKQSPDAFEGIPFDIKDHIISLIDSPRDLLALSLAIREWSTLILAVHIRYRELRIRGNQPEIWQHLAARTDLSKNIRRVCLMEPNDRRDQRLPLIWNKSPRMVKDIEFPTAAEKIRPQLDMIQALYQFKSLTSFTWLGSGQHCHFTEGLFGALANCHQLVELILGGVPRKAHLNPESSIWRIRNLRILVLNGIDWASLDDAEDSFVSMLNDSPALEELTIPYQYSSKFTSCRFHSLIKLHLSVAPKFVISNGLSQSSNKPIVEFLLAHSTIQELSWYPTQLLDFLPQGLLPALKHLYSHYNLTSALLRDDTVMNSRMLETISEMSLDLNTMRLFEMINGSRLQNIHLCRSNGSFHGIETIRRLAVLSPTIKTLGVFGRDIPSDTYNLDEYIDCFGEFPLLENLHDNAIWHAIHNSKTQKKEEIIRKLYTRCSSLKMLRAAMTVLGEEMIFFRDGLDVTWKLRPIEKFVDVRRHNSVYNFRVAR